MAAFFDAQAPGEDGLGAYPQEGAAEEFDLNGDGSSDGTVVYEDLNGDGVFDSATTMADTDADGVIDFTSTQQDTDNDGWADYTFAAKYVDTDGDGLLDSTVAGEDFNGDAVFETTQILDADELLFYDTAGTDLLPPGGDGGITNTAYEQFDPANTDMDQVVGTPAADAQCWAYQGEDGPCAIYAQVMAYEGLTGQDIDPAQMIQVATEQGWYSGSGTAIADMDKVLDYLGAQTKLDYDGSIEDLQQCLQNGGRAVVAIDGDEIWTGDNDTVFSPNDPNHAVEVIGIDYSGEEPMVIFNDSGTADGHAIMVPQSQFVDAWQDSGCAYVEAYA